MNLTSTIGSLLPAAIGIAISPVPIIAVILMLVSARGRTNAVAFLAGWLAGIAVLAVVATLLGNVLPHDKGTGPRPWVGAITVLLGLALLALVVKQVRTARPDGEEPALPAWMAGIDAMQAPRAAGLGALLGAVNPKNLVLGLSAGALVGTSGLPVGQVAVALVVFTLVASITVLVPVVGSAIGGARLAPTLDATRQWLTRNNSTILAVLLAVLGFVLIGHGIADF